jgi:cytochrome c peroxidase
MGDVSKQPGAGAPRRVTAILCVSALIVILGTANHAWAGKKDIPSGVFDSLNRGGVLRTITADGQSLDFKNSLFFKSLGTNGRSCASCHVPESGWTITPDELRRRFQETQGLDPIFRTVDGSNSPHANVSSVAARRAAFSMLLNRAVLRVGLPIPLDAEFELVKVDDPYGFASADELSLFRRPLPATNLRFLTAVMWDGRESYGPLGTTPIMAGATPQENAEVLFNDLMDQANNATMGHAQGAALSSDQQAAIAQFELNLVTAQQIGRWVGALDGAGAQGGPVDLVNQPFYVTINDVLGADVLNGKFDPDSMPLFDAWKDSRNPRRAAIARGAALFGTQRIPVTGVAGLNDELGEPTIMASCTSCHDAPNVGGHSVALPVDLGITDATRRAREMPLYTLRNKLTGQTRQTTDPGRALLSGKWKDIGKFKGPVLRGLIARPPYFHDGSAATLDDVVDFYDMRFNIGFTKAEKSDLVAFLSAL